jgi:ammonium transporter, Amt family
VGERSFFAASRSAGPDRGPERERLAVITAQSLNLAWTLLCAFLVMFMQLGFAMVETGFTRAKNAVHTMAMNFVIYPIGIMGFWLFGYGFAMGGVPGWSSLGLENAAHMEIGCHVGTRFFGLIGGTKFALASVAHDPSNLAMFLFSAVFMDTAATVPTGALAERWKFSAFVVYGLFMSMFLYPLFANWTWGGGFLSSLGQNFGLGHGHVDFAGSSVVHMTGGVTALAGAVVIGPRIGKFRKDGTVAMMEGHNLPMAIMGTIVLAFGWFGFNAGSTLAATESHIAEIAANTAISSASGALTALFYVWQRHKRPDVAMACNGMLGGLVAVTAPCAFVAPPAAALIGVVAGLVVAWSVGALESKLRVDDPVGAIAVHGAGGAWGTLSVGLFADGSFGEGWNGVKGPVRGLLFGDAGQLAAQTIGVVTNALVVFTVAFGFFYGLDRLMGIRVAAEVEWAGLDEMEMGSQAYTRD